MVEAVCVPAHLAPPGSLQDNQLCHLHAQPSLGQSGRRQEKACVCAPRVASVVSGSLQPCRLWPARLLCQGGSPGKNTGADWPVPVAIPSGALYILLPRLPTPLRTWCGQNPCDPSSCPTSPPGPHRGGPKSPRAASGANPSGRPPCRGGDKTTTETRGQCG